MKSNFTIFEIRLNFDSRRNNKLKKIAQSKRKLYVENCGRKLYQSTRKS